jgi:hypothetical protein
LIEEIWWELKASQERKLVQLFFQRLYADWTGIGAKIVQRNANRLWQGRFQQCVESRNRLLRKLVEEFFTKILLKSLKCGTEHPLQPTCGWWFYLERAKPLQRRLQNPFRMPLLPQQMLAQPTHHALAVFDHGLSKTKERPDLGAMIFDRTALPVIIGPAQRGDLRLPDKVLDGFRRDIALAAREPPFGLKKLQEGCETQTAGTGLVHQQHKLTGRKRPVVDQFVLG